MPGMITTVDLTDATPYIRGFGQQLDQARVDAATVEVDWPEGVPETARTRVRPFIVLGARLLDNLEKPAWARASFMVFDGHQGASDRALVRWLRNEGEPGISIEWDTGDGVGGSGSHTVDRRVDALQLMARSRHSVGCVVLHARFLVELEASW